MATGGTEIRNRDIQTSKETTRKCRIAGVRKCGLCEKTADVTKVKWFCRSCDLILCCDCTYHVPEDYVYHEDVHEGLTFGKAAKAFCEEFKNKTDDILMTIDNLHTEYDSYIVYSEGVSSPIQEDICAPTTSSKTDEEIKNEIICVKNSLKKLEWCRNTVNRLRDAVKGMYDQRDAFGIVKNIRNWDREFGKIVETSPGPLTSRLHMTANGSRRRIRPTVAGIKLHDKLDKDVAVQTKIIKRAWIMHAGQLFVYKQGDLEFWHEYPLSQIRPYITEGNNGEVMVFLKQISCFCGAWQEYDEEISGTPGGYTCREGKYGNTFSLDKERKLLLVCQDGHVTKRLPLPGADDYVEFCIDTERDMVCVVSHGDIYEEYNKFVFKIEYAYDLVSAQSLETADDVETADAQVSSNTNSTCTIA